MAIQRTDESEARRLASLMAGAVRGCRRHLIAAAGFSGLINLLYLAPSIFMLQVYDRVVPTRGATTLVALLVILTVALAVMSVLDAVRSRLLLRAALRLERRLAPAILLRILGDTAAAPAQRMQALRDLDQLRSTLTGPAVVALFDAPWAPIYVLVCFLLHPWLGVLALVSALALGAIAIGGERATLAQLNRVQARTLLAQREQDFTIHASDVARVMGMRDALATRHLLERADVTRRQAALAAVSARFLGAGKFLRLLLQSAALALGALLAIRQDISGGAIFAASLLLGRALQPVEQILAALKPLGTGRNALRSLDRFLATPAPDQSTITLPAPRGRIEVCDLTVRAPMGDRAILENISFAIQPGEVVAMVGPSGAGKSTLLRALAGAIAADEGEVRIDGATLDEWNREQLGRHIGYMPQTPTLFPASVHTNISRFAAVLAGDTPELDRQVVEAAMAAGAHELILALPQGYATMLGAGDGASGGGGLSAGQGQAVALARALFGAPTILFLDEPNAHLDSEGEVRLAATVAALKARGATVVVSTHRTGLLQSVDKVMLIKDGRMQLFDERSKVVRSAPANAPAAVAAGGAR
ncbi:MAG: type I secretion system permease/ATPase [Sphingomonas adhaesiva]|uniref:type I secretion system permease/ATPase n=1 Tax=Sphingomonas adhaesiva TaxID=28212 RepID=UPI002FFC6C08